MACMGRWGVGAWVEDAWLGDDGGLRREWGVECAAMCGFPHNVTP